MKTLFITPLAAVLLAAGMPSALALPNASVQSYAYGSANIDPPTPYTASESLQSTDGTPLVSESGIAASNAIWSLSAQASARIEPGVIRLATSGIASAMDVGPPSYVAASAHANASARWVDTFTIDGGALNGQVGHLVAGFRVDGSLSSAFDASVGYSARMDEQYRAWLRLTNAGTGQDVFASGGQRHLADFQGARWLPTDLPERSPGLWLVALDFVFGTPIMLDMWADIYSNVTAYACDSVVHCVASSSIAATVDFGHTVNWDGFVGLTDGQGNQVTNFTLSSVSGLDYRNAAAPVPEPHGYALLLAGLGLLGAIARRRGARAT
jgi:MYXO-CTERM domain-containing protein